MKSHWGRTFAKATRFLYHLLGFEADLADGLRSFNGGGIYCGPSTKSKAEENLIGKAGGKFTTRGAVAWPSLLCKALAGHMWTSFGCLNLEAEGLAGGVARGSDLVVSGLEQDFIVNKGVAEKATSSRAVRRKGNNSAMA